MIRAQGLTKRFDGVAALAGAGLAVPAGGILVVTGPSGSGKTTLLRLLAGLEVPDEGTVEISGAAVSGPRAWVPPERRGVAMVFQRPALWPHLSVLGNVAFGLPGRREEALRRALSLLDALGLAELGRRKPQGLSGGQAQRVALARALAPRCPVLLLDEPYAGLDAGWRERAAALVAEECSASGATRVLVLHDLTHAPAGAPVFLLEAGRAGGAVR